MKTVDILNEGFKKRYLAEDNASFLRSEKSIRRAKKNESYRKISDNEDWVNYLTRKLDLDRYESEMLLHDLNNLRANEWVEYIEDSNIPSNVVSQFKKFFGIEEVELDEGLSYFNNIDKDLIQGAQDNGEVRGLVTANSIKCSKSAIANVKYLLSKGKKCRLCLGSFVDKDGNTTKEVSHVWVEDGKGNRAETGVPSNSKIKEVKKFKSIILTPDDLDRLEKKITKFVKY